MELIPAVDIRKGRCVQLVGGDPDTEKSYGSPLDAALKWENEGANFLHVIDLDAAMGEGENLSEIREIVNQTSMYIQVGGGIRDLEKVDRLLDIGVDRVILGTVALKRGEEFDRIVKNVPENKILVALDSKDGKVLVEGWKEKTEESVFEMAKYFEVRGVGGFLFTNVEVEGKLEGLDIDTVSKLVQKVDIPIFAAGGVESMNDIKKAKKAGVKGLIVGTAIYEKELSFKEAMEVVKSEKSRN